ncbi:MAG: hypothetical protein WBA28_09185 [Microbacteriaceae bacterium]
MNRLEEEEYLTPVQVSLITKLSVQALAQMRYRRIGPSFLKPTRRKVLYLEADVRQWLDGSRVEVRS